MKAEAEAAADIAIQGKRIEAFEASVAQGASTRKQIADARAESATQAMAKRSSKERSPVADPPKNSNACGYLNESMATFAHRLAVLDCGSQAVEGINFQRSHYELLLSGIESHGRDKVEYLIETLEQWRAKGITVQKITPRYLHRMMDDKVTDGAVEIWVEKRRKAAAAPRLPCGLRLDPQMLERQRQERRALEEHMRQQRQARGEP